VHPEVIPASVIPRYGRIGERTMFGGRTMSVYFFRREPGAAELRRLARRESGRVCQRVLMIANLLEGMSMGKRRGWLG
jgi:hypothetical protein